MAFTQSHVRIIIKIMWVKYPTILKNKHTNIKRDFIEGSVNSTIVKYLVAKVLDCDIVVSKFELQSCHYV